MKLKKNQNYKSNEEIHKLVLAPIKKSIKKKHKLLLIFLEVKNPCKIKISCIIKSLPRRKSQII
jgi:hypothetical protein